MSGFERSDRSSCFTFIRLRDPLVFLLLQRELKCQSAKMFYDWEEFNTCSGSSTGLESRTLLVGDRMESPSDLEKQIGCTSVNDRTKDSRIDTLQRCVESTTASLISEQAKHAEAMARNMEL